MSSSSPTSPDTELRSRYDALVERSPQGSVFATSWWLDAVADGRWELYAAEKGQELVAAWPTVVRSGRWGRVHVGARLTPFLGPLLPPGEGARRRSREIEAVELLLERIGSYAHLEARCSPAFDYWTPLRWRGFTQTTAYTWRFPEIVDPEETFRGFGEKVRGHIRSAEKGGLVVGPGTLAEFLEVHDPRAAGHEGRTLAPRELVHRIDAAAEARAARDILLARDGEGVARAGCYLVHDARFTYYLMSATDGEVRGSAALVVREAIRRAAERGTGFDFEGSMLPRVEPFVRSFGGVPTPYSIVRHTPSRAMSAERVLKRALRNLARRPR